MGSSVRRVTAPVEFEDFDDDGVQFTLRSGPETFTFHMAKRDARSASAEVWREFDMLERKATSVVPIGAKRRAR